ncbi:heme-binding domain-containing protein [Aestuariivivens marinum]|uniref:heme-binding domain-containing protein n=1 Tax=Aestuariivivens marinum TaxID=2913555 RepID=UPI001F59BB26|nr:heme-binding domain-containing protein [Aestuariivivens marinum]
MKRTKKIILVLLLILVLSQFFGPEKNQGDLSSVELFLAETKPPEDVKLILKEVCYDCHSNYTRYPWYNTITPVNYWLAGHIKDGKKHFNVSNWVGNSIKRKDHKFEELIEMVEDKSMPLKSYTWTHAEAKLSDTQIRAVVDWAKLVRTTYVSMPKPE